MPAPYWTIISVSWAIFWIYWSFATPRRLPTKRKAVRAFTVLNTGLLSLSFLLILWKDADDERYGQFWFVAYHTLKWLDLFLTGTMERFASLSSTN